MSSSDDDMPLANGTKTNGVGTNGETPFMLLCQPLRLVSALEILVAQAACKHMLFSDLQPLVSFTLVQLSYMLRVR